jgi:hypothetical protein
MKIFENWIKIRVVNKYKRYDVISLFLINRR